MFLKFLFGWWRLSVCKDKFTSNPIPISWVEINRSFDKSQPKVNNYFYPLSVESHSIITQRSTRLHLNNLFATKKEKNRWNWALNPTPYMANSIFFSTLSLTAMQSLLPLTKVFYDARIKFQCLNVLKLLHKQIRLIRNRANIKCILRFSRQDNI